MKTYLLKDTAVGALLITFALWVAYYMWMIAGYPPAGTLFGLMTAAIFAYKLITIGIKLIIGVHIEME